MQLNTHLKLDQTLNGTLKELKNGYAKVTLQTTPIMIADEEGLVHGGFIFSAADFTAMAAINDPYVVLAKSETTFLAPVKVGEVVSFEGTISQQDGNRATVDVIASVNKKVVFKGIFFTAVLKKHVLS